MWTFRNTQDGSKQMIDRGKGLAAGLDVLHAARLDVHRATLSATVVQTLGTPTLHWVCTSFMQQVSNSPFMQPVRMFYTQRVSTSSCGCARRQSCRRSKRPSCRRSGRPSRSSLDVSTSIVGIVRGSARSPRATDLDLSRAAHLDVHDQTKRGCSEGPATRDFQTRRKTALQPIERRGQESAEVRGILKSDAEAPHELMRLLLTWSCGTSARARPIFVPKANVKTSVMSTSKK